MNRKAVDGSMLTSAKNAGHPPDLLPELRLVHGLDRKALMQDGS